MVPYRSGRHRGRATQWRAQYATTDSDDDSHRNGDSPATATATTAPPLKFTTPMAAATHLYDAWKAGDKATARQGASAAAVAALFAKTWKSGTYFFGGCSTDTQCQYNFATGAIMLTIGGNASAGYTVTNVEFGSAG